MIRKLLIGAGVFVLFVALVVTVVVLAVRYSGAIALEAAKQRWEPLGGVPDFAAMRPQPVSDNTNAAVVYRRAYEMMDPIVKAHREYDGDRPFAAALCDERGLDEIVELGASAAAKPQCVWESAWFDEGFEALLPHLGDARTLALLLAAAAECYVERGEPAQAARALAAGLVLGSRATESEPSILSALVAASIHNTTLRALEESFRERELPRDDAIARALNAINYREMLRQCLIGETAVGLDAFESFVKEVPPVTVLAGWSVERDAAQYLDLMRHGLEQLDIAPAERDWSPFEREPSIRAMLTHLIAPAINRGVNNAFSVEARLLLAREAIKLREHRAANGSYPESWPMPIDPVTGSPLRYERDGEGFVLWSEAEVGERQEPIEWRWR